MKKIILLFCAAVLAASCLGACGEKTDTSRATLVWKAGCAAEMTAGA